MFDISFFELLLVSVVALLVLGPERLPGAVRTAGLWIGRLKRSFNNIKKDIEKEIGADDIRRQLRNEAIMEKYGDTKNQFTKTIDSVKAHTDSIKDDLDLKKQFDAVAGFGQTPAKTESTASTATGSESSAEAIEPAPAINNVPSIDANVETPELNFDADPSESTASVAKPSEQK